MVSLVFHTALTLPLVLPRPAPPPGEGPIDRMVVFLVPPDVEGGRRVATEGIDWRGIEGTEGEVEPAETQPAAEPLFVQGTAGEPEAPTEPVGEPAMPEPEESALTEIEVDSMVERDPSSAAPVYPVEMLERNMEGATFVHYVVDTTGRVDTLTIRVIRSTHAAFTRSVRDALALMRFRPAVQGSRKVRQWVEQNFAFRILQRAPPPDTTLPGPVREPAAAQPRDTALDEEAAAAGRPAQRPVASLGAGRGTAADREAHRPDRPSEYRRS